MIDAPTSSHEILIVDDDRFLLEAISQTLTLSGYKTITTISPVQAQELVKVHHVSAVIADIRMPEMDGLELLGKILEYDADLPVILITGHGDISMAVEAVKSGAYHFLQKPVDEDVILATLARAIERKELLSTNKRLTQQLQESQAKNRFHGLIGSHPTMQRLYTVIESYAKEKDPVLIVGETGTGKELVARAIHSLGSPADAPYIAVNMGALPAEMIESELFGHEKGAFTGAIQRKTGKFEYAKSGTLFLDEICSMPAHLQAKLLRVLEERSFTRLGGNQNIALKARIISASNRDLPAEIAKGNFRQDLYFRLNVLPIHIPPLKERREDIPLLVNHFQEEYCAANPDSPPCITPQLLEELCLQDWPGNIRELRNVVRRFCVLGKENDAVGGTAGFSKQIGFDLIKRPSWKTYMAQQEKHYLEEMLRLSGGQVSLAHQQMGISRKSLYDKINKYAIDLKQFRKS